MKFLPGIIIAMTVGAFNTLAWSLNYGWWGALWGILIGVPIGAGVHTMLVIWPAVYKHYRVDDP